jgi:CBS-domain-containing membrane protein
VTKEDSKKGVRKTISQLSKFDLEQLIEKQKEMLKTKPKSIEYIIEKNKLARLQRELEKRNVKQIRL